jgi:peptidoglycan hydrolase CwlO-like protein
MSQISRKYDFQAGLKAKSQEVDDELNQLVDAHNSLDSSVTSLTNRVATNETTIISTQSSLTGKTDRGGDHLGTWQGLQPSDLNAGQQALNLAGKEDKANKGLPNGYASLDGSGNIPATQLGNVVTNPIATLMYWVN